MSDLQVVLLYFSNKYNVIGDEKEILSWLLGDVKLPWYIHMNLIYTSQQYVHLIDSLKTYIVNIRILSLSATIDLDNSENYTIILYNISV